MKVAELSQAMGQSERGRSEREKAINAARGQRLARELAIAAYKKDDCATAAQAMEQLERFGPLGRGDYYSRASIRERLGDDERSVLDYGRFIDLSTGTLDDTVGKAITALTRLRSRLAEKRTAAPPGGP